jgi:hypothetical protein
MDTIDSVESYTGPKTKVMCAVDAVPTLADKMKELLHDETRVHCSPQKRGWGAGLYTLLVEAMEHAEKMWPGFGHFMSIDYDTLFIGPEADRLLLDLIRRDTIGLIGRRALTNTHWQNVYEQEKERFWEIFGRPPDSYIPGEGVQGGGFILTRAGIDHMKARGMFAAPYRRAKQHTHIADDHLIPIFIHICGLEVLDCHKYLHCKWKASRDPRGLEQKGVLVFHPTKLRPNNKNRKTEVEIRNYFRRLRGKEPLP